MQLHIARFQNDLRELFWLTSMEHWFFNDIISFFVSILFAGIVIPQILHIAFRKQLFDKVDDRKIHKTAVPRLGGLAFFPSILFSFAVVIGFNLKYYGWDSAEESLQVSSSLVFLICAVLVMYAVGIADDLVGVKYTAKFVFQILSAVFIVFSGIYIENFFGFLWIHGIDDWIGWIVTGFMVLYVVNSINLIDGIDGLASGLSALAFIFYAIIFYYSDQMVYSLLSCASAGTLLPFFYYNVFGKTNKHKKIFMGDTGSLTIGMILVFCALGMLHMGQVVVTEIYNPVILGISPLVIPLFDSIRVSVNRISHRRNPFKPDKTHIHHRLMSLGFSQRYTLCIIMVASMIYIIINMFLSHYINPTFIIIADAVIWIVANLFIKKSLAQKQIQIITEKNKAYGTKR